MSAFRSAGAFPDLVDMAEIVVGNRITAEAHDRIGEMRPFVGFNPRFRGAASA